MSAIHWAAGLIGPLKATGTGQGKIDIVKAAMADRFHDPAHAKKPLDHPDRHLTAAEAITSLKRAGAGEVTLDKARQLAGTGQYTPPPPTAHPGDLLPPPPTGEAPVREVNEDEETVANGEDAPGVQDLSADVDAVGPKELPPPPAPKRRNARAKVNG